jgi:hypothetical protein
MAALDGKTLIGSGGSRGTGEAIALRAEGVTDFAKHRLGASEDDLRLDPA